MTMTPIFPDCIDDLAQELKPCGGFSPFSSRALDFCAALRRHILDDQKARKIPDLAAFAHWIRPGSLKRMAEHHKNLGGEDAVLGARGVVFHLPPANVPSLFAYGWLLSFLCGNRNIVRLSPRLSAEAMTLMEAIRRSFADYPDLARGQVFLSYGHEDEITARLSAMCDVRVIWGGDAAVAHIRSISLPPLARDLCFGDRFSMAAFRAETVLSLSDDDLEALGHGFFDDVFPFDQMACSSPRLTFMIGSPDQAQKAEEKLFGRLAEVAIRRGATIDAGTLSARLSYAYRMVLDGPVTQLKQYGGLLTVATLSEFYDFRADIYGAGMMCVLAAPDLAAVADHILSKDQTLACFGFSPSELADFARLLNGRGFDRLVPVGQALAFDFRWDGMDLIAEFSRIAALGR